MQANFGVNEAMHNAFQYWLSITFALILTARLGQKHLNRPLVLILAVLYFACALFFIIDWAHWVGTARNLPVTAMLDVGWPAGIIKTVYRFSLFAVGTLAAEIYLFYSYSSRGNRVKNREP